MDAQADLELHCPHMVFYFNSGEKVKTFERKIIHLRFHFLFLFNRSYPGMDLKSGED